MKALLAVFVLVAFASAEDATFLRKLHQELGEILKMHDLSLKDSVPFTDCGGASMTATKVTVDPWPIKAGANVNVNVAGDTKAAFTVTQGLLDVIYSGVVIFEDKLVFSGQCESGVSCSVTSTIPIPSMIPPGTYDLKLHLKDSSSKEHVCALFRVTF